MSYQVLARKWRPANFDQLVGQQQTAQALINALESQRLHHAYLFTGTRGVGKTTIARILSKSLNCEIGITANPCGECSSCVEIAQGNFVDLLEIDAASKTKVEDTRELLDNVQYRPTRGRYKVYLIDEVHMLSGHSFNALLKTLEEPPPHVIFLLATTDPQKMPVTVLSRCLQFHLRRMQVEEISQHLTQILTAEGIDFESEALDVIAKGADGSMRDGLSLLDQAIAFCGGKVEQQAVLDMLGSIDKTFAFKLLEAISQNDAAQLIEVINTIAEYAPDYDELLADWLSLLYKVALEQAVPGQNQNDEISHWAAQVSPADIQLFYQLSLQARKDLGFAPHPKQGFEMAMLRVLAFKPQRMGNSPIDPTKKKVKPESQLTDIDSVDTSQTSRDTSIESTTVGKHNQSQSVSESIADFPTADEQNQSKSAQAARSHTDFEGNNPDHQKLQNKPTNLSVVVDNTQLSTCSYEAKQINDTNDTNDTNDISQTAETEHKPNNISQTECVKLTLDQVNQDNWFQVVDSLDVNGQGLQVLLNAIAEVKDNSLQINYLEKVAPLLISSSQSSIIEQLQAYFQLPKLKVVFNQVSQTAETPRQRQDRLHQIAIEQAQQKLLSDPQMQYLIEHLSATFAQESIKLHTS
jgi:DNA polymerase III subunit gamma/tau